MASPAAPRSRGSTGSASLRLEVAKHPLPFVAALKTQQNWIAVARFCSTRTVHGPGAGYWAGVGSMVGSEAAACEWAGRAGLGGLKGEVEGYTSHGRNYFQEEVTCGPSWGTFQIPIPLSVCS